MAYEKVRQEIALQKKNKNFYVIVWFAD